MMSEMGSRAEASLVYATDSFLTSGSSSGMVVFMSAARCGHVSLD